MENIQPKKANFGTAPVFFAAISTILGAIMFLRFGYAVGNVGFILTLAIILIGHMVTIPTAMAIAEIATNQKVEGGGEYFIISRSFGINIGSAIGITLFLSQAISVAFYIIAFAAAFEPVLSWVEFNYNIIIYNWTIPVIAMSLLTVLMLTKGADMGVKVLYFVVGILVISLGLFFAGTTDYQANTTDIDWFSTGTTGFDNFFVIFAICFPAFTGMTAGVGLSGDLKNPRKAIPIGTLVGTITGMIIYVFIAWKLYVSASAEELSSDYLIMSKIALWGPIIPIGLAAATISSALGSIMVAPRTLQALGNDQVFGRGGLSKLFAKGSKNGDPKNATILTVGIAFAFIIMGDVNSVAKVISMFFMMTYGAICLISVLQHFAADPSYRPSFKSKWWISLLGAILSFFLMFKIDGNYAMYSILAMVIIFLIVSKTNPNKEGLVKMFQGVAFQLSRLLQVFIQKSDKRNETWRPSIICISADFFHRPDAYDMMRWISHKYGFGTYIHYINGYFSKEKNQLAKGDLVQLLSKSESSKSKVYADTMISPSYTSAIAQALQMPSVSGKEINTILFEYMKDDPSSLNTIIENVPLAIAGDFDLCILSTSKKGYGYKRDLHIWMTYQDYENANLMILMSYIILGHPEWKKAKITINAIYPEDKIEEERANLTTLIKAGRIPISGKNINFIAREEGISTKAVINERSGEADLTIIGFREESMHHNGTELFSGYDNIGNILFINTRDEKEIETE